MMDSSTDSLSHSYREHIITSLEYQMKFIFS